jgi:hypothetical protein
MGDKSPKSKQREQKQKTVNKQQAASNARVKQEAGKQSTLTSAIAKGKK